MNLVSLSEDKNFEKRIAITPEIVKKYIALGLEVLLPESYGIHLGFNDKEYKDQGVKILTNEKEILETADVIVQLGLLSDDKNDFLKENQTCIGVLNPFDNKEKIDKLVKKKN